jgi:hypothetical protein
MIQTVGIPTVLKVDEEAIRDIWAAGGSGK